MKHFSILIPTFNDTCIRLVSDLQRQATLLGTDFEIVVADDGSTDDTVLAANRQINGLPHCRLIEHKPNIGRARIRNFLASQAQYEWLLFIDSDMTVCRDDFLERYATTEDDVIDGGVLIGNVIEGNLRAIYEKTQEQKHGVAQRQQSPYQDFHTANFMIRRSLMVSYPFDERFRHYGYEDVLFGKVLEQHGIGIRHIDNPMSFEVYESNAEFVAKTEEGLRTLFAFRQELQDYSRLLRLYDRISFAAPLLRLWHRLFGSMERRNLTGSTPRLSLFSLYRMGYYAMLC